MLKTIFKTTGILCMFSFIFKYGVSFIGILTNVLTFMEYPDRVNLSFVIGTLLYCVSFYLFAQSDGYNLTSKLRFNIKEQIIGTVIGVAIYSAIAAILIFCPSGLRRLFNPFYYITQMQLVVFDLFLDNINYTAKFANTLLVLETPIFIGIRLLGLFVGRHLRILETPGIKELIEKVQSDVQQPKPAEEKKSWRDSINRME